MSKSLASAAPAIAAALLFGASTPLAKWLGGDLSPLLLAGLLYLGSGLGLAALLLLRRLAGRLAGSLAGNLAGKSAGRAAPGASTLPGLDRQEALCLFGAILAGGVIGPVLLMMGLTHTDGASAALLLNLEGVLTALIAWWVFKENADRQIVLGMIAIVAGGVLLAWQAGPARQTQGAALIVGACLCWAVDNNLTRRVSAHDAMELACLKGLVAGVCNTSLGLFSGAALPAAAPLLGALAVGFAGYGVSLALFVLALRSLGAARAGAYFSVAPLFGVLIAFALWPQQPSWTFWLAAVLMAFGVWLHLRERHEHAHAHRVMTHSHPHDHDEHHQHEHDFPWDPAQPHSHAHRHAALTHRHVHYPDIHHRHEH
jgi:drug/metabolite transporter (DMT)-like permease